MRHYLYLFINVVSAFLLAVGILATANVFKTDGCGAGITSTTAWIIALVMLWFFGPQRQPDDSLV